MQDFLVTPSCLTRTLRYQTAVSCKALLSVPYRYHGNAATEPLLLRYEILAANTVHEYLSYSRKCELSMSRSIILPRNHLCHSSQKKPLLQK